MYDKVERTCFYVGLDPYMGLYHTECYGKPSLVLDLARFSHCSVEIWQNTGEFATLRASESVCASQWRWKHLAVLFESANLLCHSISTHTSPR